MIIILLSLLSDFWLGILNLKKGNNLSLKKANNLLKINANSNASQRMVEFLHTRRQEKRNRINFYWRLTIKCVSVVNNVGVLIHFSPVGFPLNSETVKAVTLAFSAFSNISLDIHAKFGIPNWPQSPDIGQNSDRGICNFSISGQIPYKRKLS